jgi:hypothetical protein
MTVIMTVDLNDLGKNTVKLNGKFKGVKYDIYRTISKVLRTHLESI